VCPAEESSALEQDIKVFGRGCKCGGTQCWPCWYDTGYHYVTMEDTEVLRSKNHPSSVAALKTFPAIGKCAAIATFRKNAGAAKKLLANLEVSSIIISNGIDSKLHLLALAKKEKDRL